MGNKSNVYLCPTCGQKVVSYKHNLNKTLVSCLRKLYMAGGHSRLDKLQLDNTQFTNFQKLRYFGLAFTTGQHGEWHITNTGRAFLAGRVQVSQHVITRNALVIQKSVEQVYIHDIKDCVSYKVEWQEQASQPTLFD